MWCWTVLIDVCQSKQAEEQVEIVEGAEKAITIKVLFPMFTVIKLKSAMESLLMQS